MALQELDSGCTAKTLQVPPYATVEDVCQMCALKFQVLDPENYGLFLQMDGSSQQLAPDTHPQKIKAELHSHPETAPFFFVYRHLTNSGIHSSATPKHNHLTMTPDPKDNLNHQCTNLSNPSAEPRIGLDLSPPSSHLSSASIFGQSTFKPEQPVCLQMSSNTLPWVKTCTASCWQGPKQHDLLVFTKANFSFRTCFSQCPLSGSSVWQTQAKEGKSGEKETREMHLFFTLPPCMASDRHLCEFCPHSAGCCVATFTVPLYNFDLCKSPRVQIMMQNLSERDKLDFLLTNAVKLFFLFLLLLFLCQH